MLRNNSDYMRLGRSMLENIRERVNIPEHRNGYPKALIREAAQFSVLVALKLDHKQFGNNAGIAVSDQMLEDMMERIRKKMNRAVEPHEITKGTLVLRDAEAGQVSVIGCAALALDAFRDPGPRVRRIMDGPIDIGEIPREGQNTGRG